MFDTSLCSALTSAVCVCVEEGGGVHMCTSVCVCTCICDEVKILFSKQ